MDLDNKARVFELWVTYLIADKIRALSDPEEDAAQELARPRRQADACRSHRRPRH